MVVMLILEISMQKYNKIASKSSQHCNIFLNGFVPQIQKKTPSNLIKMFHLFSILSSMAFNKLIFIAKIPAKKK